MDKIYINLNPKQKKEKSDFLKEFLYYVAISTVILLAVLVVLWIFIGIRASIYKYEGVKWSKWKEKYETIDRIKKDISVLEGDKIEFKKILTPKNKIAGIFADIFSSLPKNIWFNNISLKKDILDIRGYVVKLDEDYLVSLEKFINNLKAKQNFSSRFKKINIRDSQKNDFHGAEVLEFYIECVN